MSLQNYFSYPFAKGAAHTGNFKAVGEPGVNKIKLRQWVNLCLILQFAKWMREYDAVIILFKCATRLLVSRLFLSGAMGREKLKPVHE